MNPGKPIPDKPTAPVTTSAGYDPLLDPLPQPDVVESDTETAWARWEDSLQPTPEPAEPEPDFQDTVPMSAADLGALKKTLGS